jgi:hypothetical protein
LGQLTIRLQFVGIYLFKSGGGQSSGLREASNKERHNTALISRDGGK